MRELLTEFEDGNGYEVPWSEIPNSGDIDSFVQEFGISLNIDRLMKKFKVKIIERNGVSKDTI